MALTAEQRKADLVDRLAKEARGRVASTVADSAERFVRRYFALVAPDDIIYSSPDSLLGGALALFASGAARTPGTPTVRIYNPSVDQNGWSAEHTVIEIINDDMPFLVDSISAELNRRERTIHLLIHPVIAVQRDSSGKLLSVVTREEAKEKSLPGLVTESFMHIEIDQETSPQQLEEIRSTLERILGEVRMAVTDWRTMRAKLQENLRELETAKLPMPQEEVEEAKAFLRWLDDGNFIFLGYRYYGFETRNGQDYVPLDPSSGLGILREVRESSSKRADAPIPPEFSEYARRKDLIIISKANSRSEVHRPVPMDRIGIKRYDAAGNLIGEDRYLGLFTTAAYARSMHEVPMLRLKARRVIENAGLDASSHNGKALVEILETFPRDEFFQMTDKDLFDITLGILLLQERQRVALFTRNDIFGRFVACFVFVPRDRYTPDFKERAKQILEEQFHGRDTAVYDFVTDSPLARGLFIVRTTPGQIPEVEVKRVEAFLADAARTWSDRLLESLVQQRGEESGIELHRRYKKAFPVAYSEMFAADAAMYDIGHVEQIIAGGGIVVDLYRHLGEDQREFHCKIIHAGAPVPLSDIMPRLENMGLRVQSEVPYEIQPRGAGFPIRIRDFSLSAAGMKDDLGDVKSKFEEAFVRVWKKEAEDDGFNRLILTADLEWHEVVVLRAYAKYLKQIGVNISESAIQETLARNPSITRMLLQLFLNYFDASTGTSDSMRNPSATSEQISGRHLAGAARKAQIEDALSEVANPDEDRVLRHYVNLIDATLRTNYFQRDAGGGHKSYVSFKLDSHAVRELPAPRPLYEIFVYSPQMEGIHLRAGKVARGGIRWSDRREDFRTEILGLMKAQNVKNVVIVPMGSKGGFVVKQPSANRDEFMQQGIDCYKTLLRGMLDITDNLRGDEVVPPLDVVRRDPDDPYLVVAADKGTATFSDIANGVSADYGFWLGDAFASGGSVGYDHKKMGITARGGWEAVKRHFREIGIDTQSQDFTCVGVGDMSGDVFGNALLLSPHTRLLAAFDHRNIFLDPNPDATASFAERQRLFDLPRSSWTDYDASLLSKGGAIFDRKAKSLTVSEEVQQLLGVPKIVTPAELMQAILRANADLLWLGGIGTYVKASSEDHAAARDRANDPLRVNANELRVRVVGEGANLGFTQQARIEYALTGGRINTDAIDNSAGVDTSDHEVNIKILLYDAVERGELVAEHRNELLAAMTDEVGHLVLRDNYEQTQAISITQSFGESILDEQARFMRTLERAGKLDRAIEGLPDDETILERHAAGVGLTRPEIAILLAYSKIVLYSDLLASDLPDDPLLVEDLLLYFPAPLREPYRPAIERHRLRREIIGTYITNAMINRVRPTFVAQLMEETGKPASEIARAFTIIRESFDLRPLWSEIESLDNKVPAVAQIAMLVAVGQLLERATLWLLRASDARLDIAAYVAEFRPRISALAQHLDSALPESLVTSLQTRQAELADIGVPAELARRIASLDVMASALDIVKLAQSKPTVESAAVEDVARIYFDLGARFGLDRLRSAAAAIPADTPWQKAAVTAAVDDLFNYQSELASRVMREGRANTESVETWLTTRPRLVERVDQTMTELRAAPTVDLAMLTVVGRQLRDLAQS
jgi:glutamate dehydrogenase